MFLDESGDVGLTSRSSRYFTVVVLSTSEVRPLQKIMRRTRERFSIECRNAGEIKFNSSPDHIRKFVLNKVVTLDCHISWAAVDKTTLLKGKMNGPTLYRTVSGKALSNMFARTICDEIALTVDRFSMKGLSPIDFQAHVEKQLAKSHTEHFPPRISVSNVNSSSDLGLQVHDFVAGSVFKMLERSERQYYDIIEPKIVKEEMIE